MLKKMFSKYNSLPVQVKASMWFLICSVLQKGISTITTPIFTRLLSTTEYGQFSVFNSWQGIIMVFVTLYLYAGVFMQGLVKFSEERKIFISSLQGLTLVLVIAWTGVYLLFRSFWNELFSLTTIQMLSMLIIIWLSAVFNFWAASERVNYNYRKLVILTLTVSVARPLLGIVFVMKADDKVTARILGILIVELLGYGWLFFKQLKEGKVFFSKKYWKYALAFNIPLVPHYLSQTILSNSDRIMIEKLLGSSEAGIYSLAYSIALIMVIINQALLQTIEPWLYKKIKDKQIMDTSKVVYISLIVIALANLLLIIFAPEIIRLFAPPSYRNAIWVIPPVAMSVFFMYMYNMFADYEFYFEQKKLIAISTIFSAIINIVLNYVFIGIAGYYAAGYTTLFCYILYAICHYIAFRNICSKNFNGNNPYSVKVLVSITIGFMGLGFLFMFTYNWTLIRYLMIFIIIVICLIRRNAIKNAVTEIIKLRK